MLSRRQIFAFVASGGVAMVFPALATASLLEKARARLMPGLRMVFQETGFDADIVVQHDGLLVKAWKGTNELAFFISELKIRGGRYSADFCPAVYALRGCMERAA